MQESNLELPIDDTPPDETDINFRAYLTRMPDEKLREYDAAWDNETLMQWDGNFRSDGALMLVCCERDIEIDEYRRILEEHLSRRGIA